LLSIKFLRGEKLTITMTEGVSQDEQMEDVNLQLDSADESRGHAEPANEKESEPSGDTTDIKKSGSKDDDELQLDVKKQSFRTKLRNLYETVKRENLISKLSRTVGWRYIIVTFVLYGLDQGGNHALNELGRVYYFKDRGLTPGEAQRSIAWSDMSWNVKPLFGLVMDTLPIFGFHYRPYLVAFGALGTAAYATISAASVNSSLLSDAASIVMLCFGMNAIVWNDVAVDGLCCIKIKEFPEVDAECVAMQQISQISVSIVFTLFSGVVLGQLGVQWVYIFVAMISAGATIAATMLPDVRDLNFARVCMPSPRNFFVQLVNVLSVFRNRKYVCMFIYMAISCFAIDLNTVMVYWYDDVAKFSKTFQGAIGTFAYVFALFVVLIYISFMKGWRYRTLLILVQIGLCLISSLDLILVCIAKDAFWGHFLAISDRLGAKAFNRIKGIVVITVASEVIPDTGEATGIAILMAIGNFTGSDFLSPFVGSWILDSLGVKEGQYGNLAWAILIRSLVRLLPIPFIPFLIQSGSSLDKVRYNTDDLEESAAGGHKEISDVEGKIEEGDSKSSLELAVKDSSAK